MDIISNLDNYSLTPAQRARLDVISQQVSEASLRVVDAQKNFEQARSAAQACAAARDAKSTGIGKNNACHINTLSQLNSNWDAASQNVDRLKSELDSKNSILKNTISQIEDEIGLAKGALETSPAYNDAMQQIDKISIVEASKTKKIILFIIGSVVVLTGVYFIIKLTVKKA